MKLNRDENSFQKRASATEVLSRAKRAARMSVQAITA